MSPAQLIIIFFGVLAGLVLGIVLRFTHKIAWIKVILLCLNWMIAFSQFNHFFVFLVLGIVATFLTMVILGKLEPRDRPVHHKIEEK